MTSLGVEYGAVYTLTGPDGTVAVFNESASGNFVGLLSPESSGLDSAEVREDAQDSTEEDGGVHGNFYYGRRPVILQGTVIASSKSDRAAKIAKIKRASNALRANATLKWTDAGGASVMLLLRRQQPVRFTKGYVKDFMIPMVSANAFISAQSVTSKTAITVSSPQKSVKKYPGFQTVIHFGGAGEHTEGTWEPGTSGIQAEDGTYTTNEPLAEPIKQTYLVGSNYNFAIPTTATILGMIAGVKRKSNAVESVKDYYLGLIQGTALVGANLANSTTAWQNVATTATYGGAKNLWSASLTPVGLNATGANEAGIALIPQRGTLWGAGKKAEVDTIWLEAYYKEAAYPTNTTTIANNGDEEADPEVKLTGPMENPVIENVTTGKKLTLLGEIPSGKVLTVNFANRTVQLEGANRYYMVDFANSTWWGVPPGTSTISVKADYSSGSYSIFLTDTYV